MCFGHTPEFLEVRVAAGADLRGSEATVLPRSRDGGGADGRAYLRSYPGGRKTGNTCRQKGFFVYGAIHLQNR